MPYRALAAAAALVLCAGAIVLGLTLPVGGGIIKGSPTVLVTVLGGHGSGVVLPGGYVLTAAHVVKVSPDKIMISTDRGQDTADVEVLWISVETDIALLKIKDAEFVENVGSADLSCEALAVGDDVRAEGNPFDMRFVSQWGKVGSLPQAIGHWPLAISIGAPLAPGMSGGPVYDMDGRVVGINVGIGQVGGFYLAVPSTVACDLMGRA